MGFFLWKMGFFISITFPNPLRLISEMTSWVSHDGQVNVRPLTAIK